MTFAVTLHTLVKLAALRLCSLALRKPAMQLGSFLRREPGDKAAMLSNLSTYQLTFLVIQLSLLLSILSAQTLKLIVQLLLCCLQL